MGFSFPLCGGERIEWDSQAVFRNLWHQILYFASYVMLPELDIELQKNVDHVTVSVIRTLDAMGRRHFVVHVPTTMFFDINYLYIHEDGLSE